MLALGQIVITRGVYQFLLDNGIDFSEVDDILNRHISGDWGDVPPEDKESNNFALNNKERILSSYMLHGKKVWVITEWDRSVTTILFPSEY